MNGKPRYTKGQKYDNMNAVRLWAGAFIQMRGATGRKPKSKERLPASRHGNK